MWGSGNGCRPLVVTVHGLMGSLNTFCCTAKELARYGFDVLTFDLFGFGRSDSPHQRFSARLFAKQTLELLELLDFPEERRFFLCGFSMGGLVAMEIARRVPERIARLLLIAPAVLVPLSPMERLGISALRTARALRIPAATLVAKLATRREVNDEDRSREVAVKCASLFRSDPEKYTKSWLKSVRDMNLATGSSLYERVAASGVEVMFLWGDNDRTIPLGEVLEELREFFPSAPVTVISGAGHGLLAEYPDAVALHAARWFSGGVRAIVLPVMQLQGMH